MNPLPFWIFVSAAICSRKSEGRQTALQVATRKRSHHAGFYLSAYTGLNYYSFNLAAADTVPTGNRFGDRQEDTFAPPEEEQHGWFISR